MVWVFSMVCDKIFINSNIQLIEMNKLKKILLIFGTRPEAIKMAPLVHKLKSQPDIFEVQVCVTAQHRHMLDQVLKTFEIDPDYDLNVMKPEQDLSDVTASILVELKKIIFNCKPDMVLVHGDTTTTLATSLACFYAGISVGHVEAGLRTHDIYAPFPEEFNRQVVSKIAKWHFTPTELTRQNLIVERIKPEHIIVTGNTVIDSLHWVINRINNDSIKLCEVTKLLDSLLFFNWRSDRYVLITGHRRENFGDGFVQICQAIRLLALSFIDVHFVYPVHLNPNVQVPVHAVLDGLLNVHLINPLEYEPFIYLIKNCYFVLTDSGGIQEEAPSLGKPVLVMRDVTERPEAVESGTVELVGANLDLIVAGASRLLIDQNHYFKMSRAHNPFGDGRACDRIAHSLRNI